MLLNTTYLPSGNDFGRVKNSATASPSLQPREKQDRKEVGKLSVPAFLSKTASPSPLLLNKRHTGTISKIKPVVNLLERHSAESPILKTSHLSTPTNTAHSLRKSEIMSKVSTPEIYNAVRFETPKRQMANYQIGQEVEKSNLVVAVRIRPHHSFRREGPGKEMLNEQVFLKDNTVNVLTEGGQTQ